MMPEIVIGLQNFKQLLEINGFAQVWMYLDSVNVSLFIPVLKTRLVDNFLVKMLNGL